MIPAVPRISVIIPTLNEVDTIARVVQSMPWDRIDECIVVDNGSTDGTGAAAEAAGARVVTSPRGYGFACKAGAAAARRTSEILVFLDGDGSDIVAEMPLLLDPILRNTADFVIGSRMRGQREPGSMLPSQVFAAHFVGWLLRGALGVRYTDMGAFRAIRRVSFETLHMQELTFGWNLEMQIKAVQQGLRVLEIPVSYRRRMGGESKVAGNFSASLRAAYRILEVLFRVGFRRRTRASPP